MDIDSHFRVPDSQKTGLFIAAIFKTIPLAIGGFVFTFLVMMVGYAFIGGLVAALTHSKNAHMNGWSLFHWSILVSIALWLYMAYEQSLKKIKKGERDYRDFATRLHATGLHFDYWLALPRCAVGVDLSGKKIAFGTLTRKGRPGIVKTMPLKKVSNVGTRELTPNEMKFYGLAGPISTAYINGQLKEENQRARDEAIAGTGLILSFDDIETPEAFMAMPREYANKWFMVIHKACQGTLEPQSESRYFPKLDTVY